MRLLRIPRLAAAVATLGLVPASVASQERLVLSGATLLDGTGAPAVAHARVVVVGGRFACVSGPDGCPPEPGDQVMDLTGMWLTPGLIDAHVHLPVVTASEEFRRQQRLRFALGITTVRDGDTEAADLLLGEKPAAEQADRPVPRLVVAARLTPAYASRLGATLGDDLVHRMASRGIDAIKLKEPFGSGLWRTAIQGARATGIVAYGHAWSDPPLRAFVEEAVEGGIHGITHTLAFAVSAQPPGHPLQPPSGAGDPWQWYKDLWLSADPGILDSLVQAMVSRGVWIEPTLAAEFHWGRPITPPPGAEFLSEPPSLRRVLQRLVRGDPEPSPAYLGAWERQVEFLRGFIAAGGVVVAGSDGLQPGLDLHEEVRLIGDVARRPMAGLEAATSHAAIALNRPDLGAVVPGRLADLLVYAENPLATPLGTLLPRLVIKGGEAYPGESLRAEFRTEYLARQAALWRARAVRWGGLVALLTAGVLVMTLAKRRIRDRARRRHAP